MKRLHCSPRFSQTLLRLSEHMPPCKANPSNPERHGDLHPRSTYDATIDPTKHPTIKPAIPRRKLNSLSKTPIPHKLITRQYPSLSRPLQNTDTKFSLASPAQFQNQDLSLGEEDCHSYQWRVGEGRQGKSSVFEYDFENRRCCFKENCT